MKKINTHTKLIPKDILPADDAFHGSTKHIAAEWWYFDAIFTNDYSLHIGCRTFSKKNRGMVSPFLEIYKDGKLEAKAVKRYLFRHFQTSQHFPLVKLSNNTIIEFDQERFNDSGEWVYNVSLRMGDHKAYLTFIGNTKGWKIETKDECWTVALPKASVTGEITVNGKRMSVNGVGYHDHNWNYTLLTALNYGKGWYWGKITSKTLNVSWAKIMKTSSEGESLVVINQDNQGYFAVNPENIYFKPDKFIRDHGRKTPTSFTFQIDDVVKDVPIHVNVKMEAHDIHYNRVLIIAPYWRYHVKATGFISLGSYKETVNSTQIMEFLRFS
jgi:hypothetical protein